MDKLVEKCEKIICEYGYKKIKLPRGITFEKLQNIIRRYDKHSDIVIHSKQELSEIDKLPIIENVKNGVYIKLFGINGTFNDYVRFGKIYKRIPQTKYGIRIKKIMDTVKNAIHNNKNIFLDLRECEGGDIRIFFNILSQILGNGEMFHAETKNGDIYCYKNGNSIFYKNRQLKIKRTRPVGKNIMVMVGNKTGSSAEFMTLILRDAGAKIMGKSTYGLLSFIKTIHIKNDGKIYSLMITTTRKIYDSSGRRYYGKYIL
jgi:hypothetical protein